MLHHHIHQALKRYVKKHHSPLHKIMHAFHLKPNKMERIPPIQQGPKWEPGLPIHIPVTKEAAMAEDKRSMAHFKVYSDSSCIGGEVGATGVLYEEGQEKKVVRKYLGPKTHHTVFQAELVGMCMGTKLN
jgi:hypothetical protein